MKILDFLGRSDGAVLLGPTLHDELLERAASGKRSCDSKAQDRR